MSADASRGTRPAPVWPALLQYRDGSDIAVVNDRDHWELDPELNSRRYGPEDRLIDSAGAEYLLLSEETEGRSRAAIQPTGRRIEPREVQSFVERHIAGMGAQPEWLAEYLADVADGLEIRAMILYLSKLERPDASEGGPEGD